MGSTTCDWPDVLSEYISSKSTLAARV